MYKNGGYFSHIMYRIWGNFVHKNHIRLIINELILPEKAYTGLFSYEGKKNCDRNKK